MSDPSVPSFQIGLVLGLNDMRPAAIHELSKLYIFFNGILIQDIDGRRQGSIPIKGLVLAPYTTRRKGCRLDMSSY